MPRSTLRANRRDERVRVQVGGETRSVVETENGPVVAHNAKHARWLRMRLAGDNMATREECKRMIEESGYRCAYCGISLPDMTIDHVVPLSRGGEHVLQNMVCACSDCNSEKGDRTPTEWLGEDFRFRWEIDGSGEADAPSSRASPCVEG